MDFENNPSFCVLPWIHRQVNPDGTLKECCSSNQTFGHISKWTETWNDDRMVSIRERMIRGERIMDVCRSCYYKEDSGKKSERILYNETYMTLTDVKERVAKSMTNGYQVDDTLVDVELRFGSLCNLKCKMCSGFYSSSIRKDAAILKASDPKGYQEFWSSEDAHIDLPIDWYHDPVAMAQVDAMMPHLRRIGYSGGEPTMVPEYATFLKRCVEMGYAKDIKVDISTNGTNVNEELIALYEQFREFSVTFSLDGIGDHYEYIRYPAKWSAVRANMMKVLKRSHNSSIFAAINLVIQHYNVLYLGDIIDEFIAMYVESGGLTDGATRPRMNVRMTFPLGPEIVMVDRAPLGLREEALARFMRWKDNHQYPAEFLDVFLEGGTLQMIENRLSSTKGEKHSFSKILRYSEFVDKNKPKAQLRDKIPELYDLFVAGSIRETP